MLDIMRSHTSVRKYKNDNITRETLTEIIHAAQHASSSNFVQAYSVIHITEKKIKNEIARLTKNEVQINTAPIFLLFCADMKRLEYACQKQGVHMRYDTLENFVVSIIDVALFAQNAALAAESLGYGICYIGGVRNNPAQISKIVNLPDKTLPLFGMTIGVPDESQYVKPRLPVEAIIHENLYDEEKYRSIIDYYDEIMADYYKHRLSNKKESNWSKTMGEFFLKTRRTHMRSFVVSQGFNLK